MNNTTRKVPTNAFRFDVGGAPMKFAEAPPSTDGKPRAPITMLARTAEPIAHWYWGRIVHDMAGMQLRKETAPIDWCHDSYEILGVLNDFEATNEGLKVSGELIAFREDDRAAEVIYKGQAGVPYEASLDWSGPGARIEEIGEGVTVQVNGFAFTGPGYVVREWPLRSVAVCPYGADPNTKSQFKAEDGDELEITIFKEAPAVKTDASAKENTNDTTQHTEGATTPAPVVPATPGDDRAKFAAELKRYTEKFGADNGAKWFTDGKSFEEALELHAGELETQLTAEKEKSAGLQTKLSAVPRGEAEPVSSSDAEHGNAKPSAASKFSGLSPNLAKVADGMKFKNRK